MKNFGVAVAMAAVTVGVGLAVVAPAVGTTTARNGRIAFVRFGDYHRSTGAIYTVDASGGSERRLTTPGTGGLDDLPDWSPDGSRLVFTRAGAPTAVYTIKPDGSGLQRVTPTCTYTGPNLETHCEDSSDASFLPDGKHVVYTRSTGHVKTLADGQGWIEHSDIVTRSLSGRGLRVLVRSRPYGGGSIEPQFAPDGKRFVYVQENSALSKPAGAHALFVARADGSGQRRITPWSLDADGSPDWSPDGKLIVFHSYEEAAQQPQIYVVHPDGSGIRQLTRFSPPTNIASFSFSPDGRWIVYGKILPGGKSGLFAMHPDGTGTHAVTHGNHFDGAPDWGWAR